MSSEHVQPIAMPRDTILCGDALETLRTLPDESVQACVTSPPYFGLRSYETEPQIWDGDDTCAHTWGNTPRAPWANDLPGPNGRRKNIAATCERSKTTGPFCQRCGAWRGELGQEPTPDLYVAHLVSIFREVKRVLRDDGTLWVNIADSYAGSWGNYAPGGITGTQRARHTGGERWERPAYGDTTFLPATAQVAGVREKSLILIPARFALAMQADGWIVRNDVIWRKENCMPSSVEDRMTLAHEYLFFFVKCARYAHDLPAIAEMTVKGAAGSTFTRGKTSVAGLGRVSQKPRQDYDTRNARDVWTLPTEPWRGGHYAVMPKALAERCILAGTSPHACERCGAPWARVTSKATHFEGGSGKAGRSAEDVNARGKWRNGGSVGHKNLKLGPVSTVRTVGWRATCRCEGTEGTGRCVVLDPFMGAGTTAIAAQRNDRDWLGIELNPRFARMAARRIRAAGNAHADDAAPEDAPEQPVLWTAGTEVSA